MEHLPPLILASRSPRRRELLSRLTEAFRAETSDFDEAPLMAASLSPEDLVLALSEGKARSVLARPDTPAEAVVIGGDTVVVSPDNEIFGIPKDRLDAERMLRALSGKSHRVITGVSLVRKDALRRFSVTTRVEFYPLSDDTLRWYLATGEPLAVAGAFTLDGLGAPFVRRVEGDPAAVVGLSLAVLRTQLAKRGLTITDLWRR